MGLPSKYTAVKVAYCHFFCNRIWAPIIQNLVFDLAKGISFVQQHKNTVFEIYDPRLLPDVLQDTHVRYAAKILHKVGTQPTIYSGSLPHLKAYIKYHNWDAEIASL